MSTFSSRDEDRSRANVGRLTLNQDPRVSSSENRANIRIQNTENLMAKVDALDEKLEKINQRFFSLEGMMKQLLELHGRSAPVAVADVDSRSGNLKMPTFEGEDVHGWVYRAEKYFGANGITEDEKMGQVTRCLEGRALAWYQRQENRQPFRSWEEFKARLLGRFRDTQDADLYEQFFALTQEGTVREYREKFEFLSSGLVGLSEATLEGNFMKGLKPEIREELLQNRPLNLEQMTGFAQVIEDKMTKLPKNISRTWRKKKLAQEQINVNVARLSLIVAEGSSSDDLLMFGGEIAGERVTVVIANGTSHNFISTRIVEKLGINVTTTEVFDVQVVCGTVERSRGVCKSVKLDLQGFELCQDFIPFGLLEHVDVVLGMAWLNTLPKWMVYGSPMIMEFKVGDRVVKLKKDPRLSLIKW